jgi:DNA-binding response OmpR family regulator
MKLLVIDDNKDLTEAIYDSLDSSEIECKMMNDGKAGLDEILNGRGKYNLILLDIEIKERGPPKVRKYHNIYSILNHR